MSLYLSLKLTTNCVPASRIKWKRYFYKVFRFVHWSSFFRSLSVWHLSRCRVALRPAVLSAARVWPSVSRYLEISFGLRGPSPQAFTSFERVGLIARRLRNADGAVGIFGKCRVRMGYGPAPGPTIKKALCHTCPLGGASNKYRSSFINFMFLVGSMRNIQHVAITPWGLIYIEQ